MKKPIRLPPFVPVLIETMETPAWRAISPTGRLLYIALSRRFNHTRNNNGEIFIPQREAAEEVGVSRPTIAQCFRELEHYGFIVMTTPGCLGVDGKGRSPHWRITEWETADAPPTMDFRNWDGTKYQRPRKRGRSRTRNRLSAVAERAS